MGTAENFEVERIALCHWRLRRAWRYENAAITRAVMVVLATEGKDNREAVRKIEAGVFALLEEVEREIKTCGEMSQDLRLRIAEAHPNF